MTIDDLSDYNQAKLAGAMRVASIGGVVFVIDTRTADTKLLKLEQEKVVQKRELLRSERQAAARKLAAIDAALASLNTIIEDAKNAPAV